METTQFAAQIAALIANDAKAGRNFDIQTVIHGPGLQTKQLPGELAQLSEPAAATHMAHGSSYSSLIA